MNETDFLESITYCRVEYVLDVPLKFHPLTSGKQSENDTSLKQEIMCLD